MLSVHEIYDLHNKELKENETIHVNDHFDLVLGPVGSGKVTLLRKQYSDAIFIVASDNLREFVGYSTSNKDVQKDKILIIDEITNISKYDMNFLLELTLNEEAEYNLLENLSIKPGILSQEFINKQEHCKVPLIYSKIVGVIQTRRC